MYIGNKRYAPYVGSIRRKVMTEKALPYDAEIEYLESTGTQWIDTGVHGSANIGLIIQVVSSTSSQDIPVFGSLSTYNASGSISLHLTPYNKKWYYGNNEAEEYAGTYSTEIGVDYIIEFNIDGSIKINGSAIVNNLSVNTGTNIAISYRKGSYGQRFGRWKYKSFQIFNGSQLIRDMIPVRVGQVGYMYDRVSGELFGNSGTGDFVLGNDKN